MDKARKISVRTDPSILHPSVQMSPLTPGVYHQAILSFILSFELSQKPGSQTSQELTPLLSPRITGNSC